MPYEPLLNCISVTAVKRLFRKIRTQSVSRFRKAPVTQVFSNCSLCFLIPITLFHKVISCIMETDKIFPLFSGDVDTNWMFFQWERTEVFSHARWQHKSFVDYWHPLISAHTHTGHGIWTWEALLKLGGVGPVDNRPSTTNLYHLVQNKNRRNRRRRKK